MLSLLVIGALISIKALNGGKLIEFGHDGLWCATTRFNSSPNLTVFLLETLLAHADVGEDA